MAPSSFPKLILAALVAITFGTAAYADKMSFYFRNQQSFGVALELRGRDSGTVWPGDGKVYFLDKAERKSIPIECRPGERICWGGWRAGDDSIAFGIGPDANIDCPECCHICVKSSVETIDVERE